ncbi:DUF6415 family natural product biosynthesis protein [Streptomyces sp. MS1.AVA.4]|uniref:DUF6415 family natural product biosynthesis protein n=1 Tax=Streptomyces pratisoli TaxID=3139917 RepID=A0ACC6QGS8_9ACTN
MKHDTAHRALGPQAADREPMDLATMRESARRVMGMSEMQPQLNELADRLRDHVQLLVPEIRALIAGLPADDGSAGVARIGVDEAWRRLHTSRGFGPDAAYQHAQRLARSVAALCDHYENLAAR